MAIQLKRKTVNKTFIIAEVGPNHNGSLEMAFKYVDLLSNLDIDAIKFQLSDPTKVYSEDAFKAEYQKKYEDSDNPEDIVDVPRYDYAYEIPKTYTKNEETAIRKDLWGLGYTLGFKLKRKYYFKDK